VSETGKASRIITVNMDITLDGDTETSIYHREGTPGNYHYVKVRDAELTDADKQNYAGFTDTTQYDFAAYTVGPVIDLQNAFVWVERHGDGGTVWGTETVPSGFANGTTEGYSEYRLFVKKDQQIGKIRLSFLNNYGSFANNQLMGENDTRDSISIQLYGAGSSGTEKKISRSGEYTLEVDANNKMYALNYNSDSSADGLITLARLPNTSDSYTHKYKTLILGKNITLYGDGETEPVTGSGGAWRTIRVETFIRINENSIVIMEPNAKITNFYSKVARGIAHLASASARFYMRGGEITGNTIAASAGVITIAGNKSEYEGGTFGVVEKSGGQVYGNFSGAITVNYVTDKSRVLVKSLE
jgi:hypothetical protein